MDTSNVQNFEYSFYYVTNITTLRGLQNWNTCNVTDFGNTFTGLYYLSDINQVSNWNVENATTMHNMFSGCPNVHDFTPLSNWNVQPGTRMNNMFYGCSGLTDLSFIANWNTTDCAFSNAFRGTSINTAPHINMNNVSLYMAFGGNVNPAILSNMYFENCSLTQLYGTEYTKVVGNGLYNMTLNGQNLRLQNMFGTYQYTNQSYYNINYIGNYNVDGANLHSMFSCQKSLQNINENINVTFSNVCSTYNMFINCTKLENVSALNIHTSAQMNTSENIYFMNMFYNCINLKDITCMENWTHTDVSTQSRYIGLSNMFYNCNNLTDDSLYAMTNWLIRIAPNVINTQYEFYGGYGLVLNNQQSNTPLYGSNIRLNERLNTTQLNRLYMAGYRGFGTY